LSCRIERPACVCTGWLPSLKVVGLIVVLAISLLISTDSSAADGIATSITDHHITSERSHPRPAKFAEPVSLLDGSQLQFVGTFSSDARFIVPSKLTRYNESVGGMSSPSVRQEAAPASLLRSYERKIEAFQPPGHASARLQAESLPHAALAQIVTLVYGHAKVLQMPNHVTIDSTGRAILTDPTAKAVHIIDPHKRMAVRLIGGPQRRFGSPQDVAVDADDNIYIADAGRATVVVFDRNGRFLREFSKTQGEYTFASVVGIAIDAKAGRLYLADDAQDLVFVLDLQGNVLRSAGRPANTGTPGQLQLRTRVIPEQFDSPLDVAMKGEELVVLDKRGTRVQVMDTDCKLLHSFTVQRALRDHGNAVSVDEDGNIYVSYPEDAAIRIFSPEGRLLGSLGHSRFKTDDIASPAGMWIDDSNRLYVTDPQNARVQVFQRMSPADEDAPTGSHEAPGAHQ
jgi:sugar lactone lactonase YvrE